MVETLREVSPSCIKSSIEKNFVINILIEACLSNIKSLIEINFVKERLREVHPSYGTL